ncbi:tetratricopeptide repeat protein [Planctobacterium marinum]|uniref:TPR domain protein n=1 Tax=Planctobacterium marinum TaxID=1631968 RepID=A0AA48HSM9_9ALTE|nr:hypothetical protein MACH26_06340 [Planctobacterium marinum]
MRISGLLTIFAILLFLSGCQSTEQAQVDLKPVFLDTAFSGYQAVPVESEQEIFALDSDAKVFVNNLTVAKNMVHAKNRNKVMESLIRAIFNRSDFNMIYDNGANTTASETFNNRAANCLSLSIMTYALAKQAGFDVRFQEIDIPEYWTRKDGYSLINGHINLRISDVSDTSMILLENRTMVVDFDPFSPKKYFPSTEVNKQRVVSMFYNNKGAEALVNGDHLTAYSYLKAAVQADIMFQDAWTNLGILYRMAGHHDWAEKTYEEALKLNQDNLTIWENLAILHEHQGRYELAKNIQEFVTQKRLRNPYYHFILGEQELETGNFREALAHYKKAISIDESHHEFYFGMAKAHANLGNSKQAMKYLKRAKRNTQIDDLKDRYQHKMDLFAKL